MNLRYDQTSILKKLVFWVLIVYSATRILIFNLMPINEFTVDGDASGYVYVSHFSLQSLQFYLPRPFLYPLILKLFHLHFKLIFYFQLFISIISWGFFAVSLASLVSLKHRIFIILLTLIYSCSTYMMMWDTQIMTESLSISLLVLSCGLTIQFFKNQSGFKLLSTTMCFFMLVLLRDANLYLVAIFTLPIIIAICLQIKPIIKSIMLIAFLSAIFALSIISVYTANLGYRWLVPLMHVMHDRMPVKSDMINFFKSQGMKSDNFKQDVTNYLSDIETKYYYPDSILLSYEYLNSKNFDNEFANWINQNAKQIYTKFLISHPFYVLFTPLTQISYWQSFLFTPRIKTIYRDGYQTHHYNFFSNAINKAILFLPFLLIVLLIMVFRNNFKTLLNDRILWLCSYLIISTYLFSLIIFHADTFDMARHQLISYLFLTMVLTMMLIRCYTISTYKSVN